MSGGASDRGADGYRREPVGGARVRADVVDVFVFRRGAPGGVTFLQLLRAKSPLERTWHPIMGHAEAGETAVRAAWRELREEVGLGPGDPGFVGLWALEQVHPYYVAAIDCVVMSPRFAAEVSRDWSPRLNAEHSEFRWTSDAADFLWPGQKMAIGEIVREIADEQSPAREWLRVRG